MIKLIILLHLFFCISTKADNSPNYDSHTPNKYIVNYYDSSDVLHSVESEYIDNNAEISSHSETLRFTNINGKELYISKYDIKKLRFLCRTSLEEYEKFPENFKKSIVIPKCLTEITFWDDTTEKEYIFHTLKLAFSKDTLHPGRFDTIWFPKNKKSDYVKTPQYDVDKFVLNLAYTNLYIKSEIEASLQPTVKFAYKNKSDAVGVIVYDEYTNGGCNPRGTCGCGQETHLLALISSNEKVQAKEFYLGGCSKLVLHTLEADEKSIKLKFFDENSNCEIYTDKNCNYIEYYFFDKSQPFNGFQQK